MRSKGPQTTTTKFKQRVELKKGWWSIGALEHWSTSKLNELDRKQVARTMQEWLPRLKFATRRSFIATFYWETSSLNWKYAPLWQGRRRNLFSYSLVLLLLRRNVNVSAYKLKLFPSPNPNQSKNHLLCSQFLELEVGYGFILSIIMMWL